MENITIVSCTNISAGGHFTYVLMPFLVTVLQGDKDCEQAWYNEKMAVLSYGEILNETGLVVGVTSEKITLSKCIKLYYNVTCHGSGHKFRQIYQVINDSPRLDMKPQRSTSSVAIAVGVPIAVLILVLTGALCYLKRRKKSGDSRVNAMV